MILVLQSLNPQPAFVGRCLGHLCDPKQIHHRRCRGELGRKFFLDGRPTTFFMIGTKLFRLKKSSIGTKIKLCLVESDLTVKMKKILHWNKRNSLELLREKKKRKLGLKPSNGPAKPTKRPTNSAARAWALCDRSARTHAHDP